MEFYVEYYKKNPFTGKLYNPCGDRSTVRLDARNNLETMKADAAKFNGYRRPVFEAFRIIKGRLNGYNFPVTDIILL